jgi:cell wall-associated NlpC family hydrolase
MMTMNRTFYFIALLCVQGLLLNCSILKGTSSPRKPARPATSIEQIRTYVTGWAENYLGTDYKYAGTDPKTGFDCSGFTSFVMKEFDIQLSPGSSTQATQGNKITIDEVQPGDLIFFGKGSNIQHVALVTEINDQGGIICIHATNTRGVVKENITTSDYWKKRMLFARDVITPLAKF